MKFPNNNPASISKYFRLFIYIFTCLACFSCNVGLASAVHELHTDHGKLTEVSFATRLNHPSDLLRRDFHIVHLSLPVNSGSSSSLSHPVVIHVHRDVDLIHSSILGNMHAVFKGNFHPDGRVALTATHTTNDEDTIGFSGHIIHGRDHYYIEPLPQLGSFHRSKRSSSTSNNASSRASRIVSLPHKVVRMENLVRSENGTVSHSDVLHVPKDELEKAIKEMANFSASTTNSANISTSTEIEETDQIEVGVLESEESQTLSLNTYASTNNNNKKFGGKPVKNKAGGGKTNPRKSFGTKGGKSRIRGGGGGRTATKSKPSAAAGGSNNPRRVEVAIFSDQKLASVWQARYPKDGKNRMRTFILNLINSMNLNYQHPSLGVPISFRIVHLEMLSNIPAGLDPSGGDSTKYLTSFCKYAGAKNQNGAQWDHGILLTGHDIHSGGQKAVAGVAWMGTMCLKDWSCSLSESTSFATSLTLTHEIGHSLGMEHDGTGVSKACSPQKFIMSPSSGPGKTSWSSCSAKNIKQFLATGSASGKSDRAAIPACLTHSSPLKNQQINFSSGKLPGQIYNLQVQCEYELPGSVPSIHKKEEVCGMLWCKKGNKEMSAHPALDGSPCGNGKHCKHGKCI